MLSKQSIEKYREIYRKQFGVDISVDDAAEQANRLLNLARVVLQPMPKAWERRYNELLREKREGRRGFDRTSRGRCTLSAYPAARKKQGSDSG